jgi:hypothetical protein
MLAEVPSSMKVPYNQCMEEHHHCFFYLRVFTSLRADRSFPDSSSSQQRKKNKCLAMMLQESLGAQLRTQCSVRSYLLAKVPSRMITSILHNAWKNIAIPQCAAQAEITPVQVLSQCLR